MPVYNGDQDLHRNEQERYAKDAPPASARSIAHLNSCCFALRRLARQLVVGIGRDSSRGKQNAAAVKRKLSETRWAVTSEST